MSPLQWRWVRWTVAGELAGFVAPAVVGVLTADSPARLAVPSVVLAGAVEGLLLGAAQGHVLRSVVPRLDVWRFSGLTSVAAALAYVVVMVPMAAAVTLGELPVAVLALVAAALAAVLLASLGTAQWLELRRHVDRAGFWVPWTAVAWSCGLAVFMLLATPLWRPGQPLPVSVAVGLLGALAMATAVAVVTGLALPRLLRGASRGVSGRSRSRAGSRPRP
ncbi:hypothetical protein N798_10655 [Knoellia flava TL1]|uniref:Uncharacterized protein n=2 Tax=Knoellia flava TaxID=913969 RepID=A0A8H9FP27_9MICO|nr:hypothetical protein [Knoellia flava]KGN30458.1 hypothetical protein N798_10655 [Knoellia flava TL1]GGB65374.1 hypothetical protein GCM10011314_00710 [Knoellia flava]